MLAEGKNYAEIAEMLLLFRITDLLFDNNSYLSIIIIIITQRCPDGNETRHSPFSANRSRSTAASE
jgi:hypothetical protein